MMRVYNETFVISFRDKIYSLWLQKNRNARKSAQFPIYSFSLCQLLISADTPSYPFPQETENVIVKMYYVHMERSLHSLLS